MSHPLARVRSWSSTESSGSSVVVPFDGPAPARGNLLLAVVAHARPYAAPLLPPAGWTRLQSVPIGGETGDLAAAVYARTATGTETGATFEWSPSFLASAGGNPAFGGASAAIYTSPDGTGAWTLRDAGEVSSWRRTIWVPELALWVSVSGSGRARTSPDGLAWAVYGAEAGVPASAWNDVAWSPELGLLVAVAGTGTDRVMTSPDGAVWTARTAAAAQDWRSVAWSATQGQFAAVGLATVAAEAAMTSPDGITWTARTAPSTNLWRVVRSNGPRFVAVASSGVGDRTMRSDDGITWTAAVIDPAKNWQALEWAPELSLWLAGSSSAGGNPNNIMATSPDGITWTVRQASIAQRWDDIVWSPELQLAVAVSSDAVAGPKVQTSPDGITWTAVTGTTGRWTSVAWRPGASDPAAVIVEYSRAIVSAVDASADNDDHFADPAGEQPTGSATPTGTRGVAVAVLAARGPGWEESAASIGGGFEITDHVLNGATTVIIAERAYADGSAQSAEWSTLTPGGPTWGGVIVISEGRTGLVAGAEFSQ